MNIYFCSICGLDGIQIKLWANPNILLDATIGIIEDKTCYCNHCKGYTIYNVLSREDYLKRLKTLYSEKMNELRKLLADNERIIDSINTITDIYADKMSELQERKQI